MISLSKLVSKYSDILTEEETTYLLNMDPKTSNFYGLPKVHKSSIIKAAIEEQNEEYVHVIQPADLKFRPIVAGPIYVSQVD